jgi:hypothetical protein
LEEISKELKGLESYYFELKREVKLKNKIQLQGGTIN